MASYTASRIESGRGPLPLGRSSRVGWGPGGTLAFVSANAVHIVKLAECDAQCSNDGGVIAASENASGMLEVRLSKSARCEQAVSGAASHKQLPDAEALELSIREYKEAAAAAATIQQSHRQRQRHRQRQHLWKLAGALLAATIRPDADGEEVWGNGPERSSLQSTRRREAIIAWLRLMLAERAAEVHAQLPAEEVGVRMVKLASDLQTEGAIELGIADPKPHAYLASLLAQPVASVRADIAAQLASWKRMDSTNDTASMQLIPPSLAKMSAMLAGEAAPPDPSDWARHYAHLLAHGKFEAGEPPPPPPLGGGASPTDAAWHLLRLVLDPTTPVAPLPARELAGPSMSSTRRGGASPIRVWLPDSSLAWHLRLVVGEMLRLYPPSEDETVHRDYLDQLEMTGRWHELLFAATAIPSSISNEAETATLASLLCRLPPPDEPPDLQQSLLDLEALDHPAPLTPAAQVLLSKWFSVEAGSAAHPQDPHRIISLLHAALAIKAFDQRRPAAVVRHYLSAADAARAADAILNIDSTMGLSAEGDATNAPGASLVTPTLSGVWELARQSLCTNLLPPMLLGDFKAVTLPEDALRALERLADLAPPGSTSRNEWILGGGIFLAYTKCLQAFADLDECIKQGRMQDAPRPLAAIKEDAETLRARLATAAMADEAMLEWENTTFGRWSDESAAIHACHRSMADRVRQLLTRIEWLAGILMES